MFVELIHSKMPEIPLVTCVNTYNLSGSHYPPLQNEGVIQWFVRIISSLKLCDS